jgi:hypothetical protein
MNVLSAAISTKIFDHAGSLLLFGLDENTSDLHNYNRRLTRTATLDTGVFIDDRGYFDGDRSIEMVLTGTDALFNSLLYLIQNYSSVLIMLPDGAYNGNISKLRKTSGKIRVSFLIESAA